MTEENSNDSFCRIPEIKKNNDLENITFFDSNGVTYFAAGKDKKGKNFYVIGTCDGKYQHKYQDSLADLADEYKNKM